MTPSICFLPIPRKEGQEQSPKTKTPVLASEAHEGSLCALRQGSNLSKAPFSLSKY